MKLVKSLALGTAAAFLGLSGAQAADLPGAEAVEYVKVCDAYGAGFFYIPGTETCLQIGGFARAEYTVGEVTDEEDANNTGYRVRARVWFDARTDTEYGALRTFVRLQFQRETGNPAVRQADGTFAGQAAATNRDLTADDAFFDQAYVQFGGLTAGVTDSFWDFKPYPTFQNPFVSDRTLPVLAYTMQFGGGFSASVSLEDKTARYRTDAAADRFAGQDIPDVVGNVRVKQGWGEAQLSGFYRRVEPDRNNFGGFGDKENGYGAQFGVKVNLPTANTADNKGDFVWGQVGYAKGNLSYLGLGDANVGSGTTQNVVNFNPQNDFNVDLNGDTRLTSGWNANLGVLHYWSPKWRSALQGSYVNVNDKRAGSDWDAYTVAGNLIWTPVKKLDIGGELIYVNTDLARNNRAALRSGDYKDDAFIGRLRVQRDF